LIPVFVLLFVFLALPMINSIQLSVSRWGGLGPLESVGFDNYKFLFSDPQMRYSSRITIFYAFSVAFLVVAIATLLAAAVSANVRGHKAMKIIWFFPGIAPPTAVAIFWSSSFQPESGVVNVILGKLGLGDDYAWLASSDTALYPVIFVGVWSAVGFAFLVILGAVEQIPVSLREAALVDGANVRQQFTKITLPLIRPKPIRPKSSRFSCWRDSRTWKARMRTPTASTIIPFSRVLAHLNPTSCSRPYPQRIQEDRLSGKCWHPANPLVRKSPSLGS
jgi:ABC-type sugar transport system permease subunit